MVLVDLMRASLPMPTDSYRMLSVLNTILVVSSFTDKWLRDDAWKAYLEKNKVDRNTLVLCTLVQSSSILTPSKQSDAIGTTKELMLHQAAASVYTYTVINFIVVTATSW